METWYEMKNRHHKERMNQVKYLAVMGYTQTQAAKILDVKLTMLNNFVKRNNIYWPVIEQGKKTNETTAQLRSRVHILKAAS